MEGWSNLQSLGGWTGLPSETITSDCGDIIPDGGDVEMNEPAPSRSQGHGHFPSLMTLPAVYSRSRAASRALPHDSLSRATALPPSEDGAFSQGGNVFAG